MVGQADADVGELPAVPGKDPQQTPLQGKTAGGNAHGTRLQALTGEQLRLAGGDALKGGGNVRVELFPLWRQANPLGGAEEQGAAQLRLQTPYHAGHIGLVVVERGRGLRKALVFGGVVENAIAVIADVHDAVLL